MKSAEELVGLTIGGFGSADSSKRDRIFSEYVKRALPSRQISGVKVISTPAALNSVTGSGNISGKKYFFKVHIESGSKSEEEYRQAGLLEAAGWPVYAPDMQSENPDFPLLAYPWTDDPTLFDKLLQSYLDGESRLTDKDFIMLEKMNKTIGQTEIGSLKKISANQADHSPVQMFFARRFEADGRIDNWYGPKTTFSLPVAAGKELVLSWSQIKRARWTINGQAYPKTLKEIIEEARHVLIFSGEDSAWATTSHGDDHAGNIFLSQDQARVFDPAAADDKNPAILSDVKALAHSGFLPMAGMYYDPELPCFYSYNQGSNTIGVETDFESASEFETHMKIAGQIIDLRVNPMLRALKERGADMDKETGRLKAALVGCALLTVNISKLLAMNDGRAGGLLPMAVLLYELKGFKILERVEV